MTRDDRRGHSSVSDSATGRVPGNKGDVGSKTARPDALAAIMRDSTIIVDARVYPVPTFYLPQTIRPLRPVPPADRGDSDEAQRVSPSKRRAPSEPSRENAMKQP